MNYAICLQQKHLRPELICFLAMGCIHQPVIADGRHSKDLPEFRWINTVISNLKTSFSGTFHALRFRKYANRYLGAFCYLFNRRFHLEQMTARILHATCRCTARPERTLRSAELAT
jgi:hypothetical protein